MLSLLRRNKFLSSFLILFVVLYIITQFVHFNRYKSLVQEQFSNSNLKINIEGNIEFELFPLPHLELNDVLLRYNDKTLLSAGTINKGGLNPFNKQLDNLTVVGAHVNYPVLLSYIKDLNDEQNSGSTNEFLENLAFKGVRLIFSKDNYLEDTTGSVKYAVDSFRINLDGLFNMVPVNLKSEINDIDSNLNSNSMFASISSGTFMLNFEGGVQNLFSGKGHLHGKLSTKLENLELLAQLLDLKIQEFGYLENEHLTFNADFKYDGRVSLDNISINSVNINNLKSSVNYAEDGSTDIVFEAEKIDLDGMFGYQKMNVVQRLFFKLLERFNSTLPESNARFSSKISSIVVNEQEIKDFIITADVANEIITLSQFSASFPGSGALKVEGVITHNDIRPIFQGELNFAATEFEKFLTWLYVGMPQEYPKIFGNNLLLKSEVIIVPHRLILNDIKGVLDEKLVQGKYYLKENRGGNFNLDAELKLSELNLDKADIALKFEDLLIDLAIADNDKTAEYYSKLTNDFLGLRRLRGSYDFDIEVGALKFNSNDFENFRVNFRMSPSVVDVKSISIKDEYSDFSFFSRFTVPRIKPEVTFGIIGKSFDKRTLDKLVPKYLSLITQARAKAKNVRVATRNSNSKTQPASVPSTDNISQNGNAEAEFKLTIFPDLNSFGLTHIDGTTKVDLEELKWYDLELKDFTVDGYLKNAVFYLNNLSASHGDGSLSLNGNLVLITQIPSTLLNFSFNNVSPSLPIYIVTGTKGFVDGYFSIVGTITTSGVTFTDWGNKLTGKAQFAGKKIEYQGFDLAKIIEVPDLNVGYQEKIKRITYYENYGSTIFDDLSGKISVESGIATLSDGIFKNSRTNGIFVSNYDILNRQIILKSRFNFFVLSSNIPISVDISTSGVFANRKTTFDNSKLIEFITARAASSADAVRNNNSLLNSRLR